MFIFFVSSSILNIILLTPIYLHTWSVGLCRVTNHVTDQPTILHPTWSVGCAKMAEIATPHKSNVLFKFRKFVSPFPFNRILINASYTVKQKIDLTITKQTKYIYVLNFTLIAFTIKVDIRKIQYYLFQIKNLVFDFKKHLLNLFSRFLYTLYSI